MEFLQKEHTIIIGSGPCGLSTALALQNKGISPLLIEKGNVVNTIYDFPTHQTFFSSSDKLEIGNIPFITDLQSPVRSQALAYYRSVAQREKLRINAFEKVERINQDADGFTLHTVKHNNQQFQYTAKHLIVATGYYDLPKYLDIPGEELSKVTHYFKEAHPYYNQNVVIIGGKNSAVDAALELHKAGANITVLYRGDAYPDAIKPWILPKFDALVQKDIIHMNFQAEITEITPDTVVYEANREIISIPNDFVFAMTGYRPNMNLLTQLGVTIDQLTNIPQYDDNTMETNIDDCYIAGVVAAGDKNNAIFIETGKEHGEIIANAIVKKDNESEIAPQSSTVE